MLAIALAFYSHSVAAAELKPQQQSLCTAKENVFLSCPVGKKTVSFCEKKNFHSYLEYRFGSPQKIELAFQANSANKNRFYRAEAEFASNASTLIWFRNAKTNYVMHFPARGGPFLQIIESGKKIAEIACIQQWRNVMGDPEAASPFIVEHASGPYSDLSKQWD